ncbi:helix-turn-helix domain-containing protein [Natroniella sulfidigena]|uniref:helix-turn-helix domain-containing protein n=1 Tax=Natroniella sulfidigena TaxID=723921 RepID=UPI00200A5628|nr:helix-turn-helix domain-containing protein [Natroniella sulfidigena]MCK8818126.1 helix-turn-helix domain-containing protein [Natroniella sulfidigena]
MISYKPLLKLMIDKGLRKKYLVEEVGLSWTTVAKLSKEGEYVDLRVIEKLCKELNCTPNDIIEIQ